MSGLIAKLKSLLGRSKAPELSPEEEERLRDAFKARYLDFKLLLAANNRALELMADLESALAGDRIFGMPFVRTRCTALGASVFNMIKHLCELAPDKYEALFSRFKSIQALVEAELEAVPPRSSGEMVAPLEKVDKLWADRVGGKMANLGELSNRLGLAVPRGFVVTSAAFDHFLEHNNLQEEIDRFIQKSDSESTDQLFILSSKLQQLVVEAKVPEDLAGLIMEAYAELEKKTAPGIRVSLRSSALGEDDVGTSFAGQYRSYLNVNSEHILQTYKEVLASKYTPQAMHYRLERGLRDGDIAMSVGCLAMVDAKSGGVAYTRNPLDPADDNVRVTSAWGLPRGVVDGNAPADIFVVSRKEPGKVLERDISHKDELYVCYAEEGVCRMETTGEQANQASISDDDALEVARICLKLEKHYGSAQDVEWALDRQGGIKLLQARPLQQVKSRAARVKTGDDTGPEGRQYLVKGGLAASPGAASGRVYWVKKESDALGFPPGAVLAVDEPWPRWAALLGKAAAVVSRKGTMAGHLATVAREFGVPALFNLGQAADALKNHSTVTVDVDSLAVYRGGDPLEPGRGRPRGNLMTGSPVHQTLERLLAHVTPLTMLNPDAPEFRPEKARTLHDITRFCHEKSVKEMFDFGKEHRFPEKSSKQLYFQVPMQYWVINLDDGFKQEVSGKYVTLENIACLPMLALWEGMVAIPWDGPPAMSGRGFASVMFQATANPELATPFKTAMANRNYFMVSRQFVNLQSRFGFHFTTVESLAGDRPAENYLSFSFSGGAADAKRKNRRAELIGEILAERGYSIKVKEDTLRARVEGLGDEGILKRLKEVGYLLMHTRQLDMVMADPASVNFYRQKILGEISGLHNQAG